MVDLLAFEIGGQRFALPAAQVGQITRATSIAALPKAPPIVEGVVNFHGELVPVLDIRQRFGLAPRELTPDQHFVFARTVSRAIAFRVDRAIGLVGVDPAQISPAASVSAGIEYVSGIARLPDGLLVIHDPDRFLSTEEAGALAGAVTAVASDAETRVVAAESPR